MDHGCNGLSAIIPRKKSLVMYLNQVNFVYDSMGSKLRLKPILVLSRFLENRAGCNLVGMLVNPILYNPKRFPKNSILRRTRYWIGCNSRIYYTSPTRFLFASSASMHLRLREGNVSEGNALYFIVELSKGFRTCCNRKFIKTGWYRLWYL